MKNLFFFLMFKVNGIFLFAQSSIIQTFEYTDSLFKVGQIHYLELHFGFDHCGLLNDSVTNKTLYELGSFLKNHPNIVISIDCHTDSRGVDTLNLKLSEKRSIEIYRVLNQKFGLDTTQIKTNGFGEKMPIVPDSYINQLNWTKEDQELLHRLNRRIIARIITIRK